MRQAFLEQSVRAPVSAPVAAEKPVANRPPIPASARRALQLEAARPSAWPRLILYSALLLIAAGSWAFYIRSQTGAFPPFVAKIESKIEPALTAVAGKFGEPSTEAPSPSADEQVAAHSGEHSITAAHPQTPETTDAPAAVSQTSAIPAASSPAAVPTLQPVAAQSSSDHPISESVPAGAPASSPAPETSSKPDPFHRSTPQSSPQSAPQAVESSDHNQQAAGNAAGNANTRDSLTASSSRDDDAQTATPATPKARAGKRAWESASTVDGFSRQDIPDLLSQANSSTARGNYRLARYEYGLVLKLDRGNVQAREGLRRLPSAWQSR